MAGTTTTPLEFRASFARSAAENRSAFIKFLMDNDREHEAVQFIAEVKAATSGRINRHEWLGVAEKYAAVHWGN